MLFKINFNTQLALLCYIVQKFVHIFMREHQNTGGWTSPQQLYEGYRNLLKVQCKEGMNTATSPKVTTLGEVKILSQRQETPVRRILFESSRKETDQKLSDQTKKISFLKSDLSHLKVKVLQLASIEKDGTAGQNGFTSSNKSQYVKDGFLTPRHTEPYSQFSTELKNSSDTFDFNDDSSSNFPSEAQIEAQNMFTEHRLWDNPKRLQRKSPLQRDDLSCRSRDHARETNFLRQSFQSNPDGQMPDRMRVFAQNRDSNDKSLQSVVDTLRRQNAELQLYYKQKLDEANQLRNNLEDSLREREQELLKAKGQILNLQKSLVNQENLSKLVLSLQQTNRRIQKDKQELTEAVKCEQKKVVIVEEKLRRSEDEKTIIRDLKDRLLQENMRFKEACRVTSQQILKLKESFEIAAIQKDREIQTLTSEKEKLTKAVKYCSESHQPNIIRGSSLDSRSRADSNSSPKHLFISSPKNQENQIDEKKKELDALSRTILELKNEKKSLECQLETQQTSKKQTGSSFKRSLLSCSVESLQGELMLKEEMIEKMYKDIKGLESLAAVNKKLQSSLDFHESMLQQVNEEVMRSRLAFLNHKYN